MDSLLGIHPAPDVTDRSQTIQKPKSADEIREVAEKFESLFLENLLKTMRRSIPKGGVLDSGQSEEVYTYMFDQAISQRMAERGTGLAEIIRRELEIQLNTDQHQLDLRI